MLTGEIIYRMPKPARALVKTADRHAEFLFPGLSFQSVPEKNRT